MYHSERFEIVSYNNAFAIGIQTFEILCDAYASPRIRKFERRFQRFGKRHCKLWSPFRRSCFHVGLRGRIRRRGLDNGFLQKLQEPLKRDKVACLFYANL